MQQSFEQLDTALSQLPPLHQVIYQHMNNCNMKKAAAAFLQEATMTVRTGLELPNLPVRWAVDSSTTEIENQQLIAALAASSTQMSLMANENPTTIKEEDHGHIDKKHKKTVFNCKFTGCTGVFTTLANMKRHEKLHSGEKPYICPVTACGKGFARKYDLKVHSRTHTKEKPYQCNVETCAKKFSRVSSLREHERNIHGIHNSSEADPLEPDHADEPEEHSYPLPTEHLSHPTPVKEILILPTEHLSHPIAVKEETPSEPQLELLKSEQGMSDGLDGNFDISLLSSSPPSIFGETPSALNTFDQPAPADGIWDDLFTSVLPEDLTSGPL